MPRFSLVIPAYNEERLLPRLLDSVDVARNAYANRDAIEVIVVDNTSTDRTSEIAHTHGCSLVQARALARWWSSIIRALSRSEPCRTP